MCEEPTEGEAVTLRVTGTDSAENGVLADRLDEVGAVEERLRFGAFRVTVPQTRLDALCSVEGLESVETADTLGVGQGDAGEDVGTES